MTNSNDVSKYLTQQVMTASPAKLVFMLYDRAIGSLREAVAAIETGDIEGRFNANARAIEIISHMWTTLNAAEGGEIATNLGHLYPTMLSRLTQVDIGNDSAPAREVIALLEPLRDAWGELIRGANDDRRQNAATEAEDGAPAPRTSISA